jgi:hypothetical protein
MSKLNRLFRDLQHLQFQLQEAANRLWTIETASNRTRAGARHPGEFLPRRLRRIREQYQLQFRRLLEDLELLLRRDFPRGLMRISHPLEAQTALRLRTLLRSIQNAYVTDLPMRENLESLRHSLPR